MNRVLERLDMQMLLTRLVEFLPKLGVAFLVLAFFWMLFRATRKPLQSALLRIGIHKTLAHMLVNNVYRIALFVFALVMAADQVGINVGAALAGLGVAGIAIGFAAQDSLANFISGFLIFIDKPFQVGDWVRVTDQYGCVTEITMRTTRIRTNDNTYVVIPNRTIIDQVLVNHSKHGETRVNVPVGIAYKENIPRAREVLLEAVSKMKAVAEDPAPQVVVTALGASSVDLEVRVWILDASDEKPVYTAVMEASKLALDAAGIEIPYHHMQLFIENVEERVWESAARLAGMRGGS